MNTQYDLRKEAELKDAILVLLSMPSHGLSAAMQQAVEYVSESFPNFRQEKDFGFNCCKLYFFRYFQDEILEWRKQNKEMNRLSEEGELVP